MIIKFLKKIILSKSKDDDLKRREFILNILLLSFIIFIFIACLMATIEKVQLGSDYRGMSLIIPYAIFLFCLFLFYLSRIGFFVISAYILIIIFFSLASYMLYRWGVELTSGLLFYVLTIIMSGVLISTRFAFFTTLISSGFVVIMGYFQINNILSSDLYWKTERVDTEDTVMFSIIFGIIAAVSWLSNREIEKSLRRARKSEAEIKIERDNLEIKVEDRTRELKEAQMEKVAQLYRFAEFGRLSSGFFHDLANPLTAVSLNMEKMKNNPHIDAINASKYLTDAITATHRMEKFITTIRKQIAKEETKEFFSLSEEIIQAIQILSCKAQKANVDVNFFPFTDVQIYGDSIKFSQVVTNLIANAIDAYEDGESVNRKKREIKIKLSEKDGLIYLIVEDWGGGISQKNIDKVFKPFFTTKGPDKGTGIGLSLTKNIIEKDFCGSIKVQSGENCGTKFIIKIPIGEKTLKQENNLDDYLQQIAAIQQENGGFLDSTEDGSILYTALILSCLNNLEETGEIKSIKERAVDFLLSKKDGNWSFSENMHVNFCALSALTEHDSKLIDGAAIAKILMLLTSIEEKEGGPYYSWLNSEEKKADLAVNGSIAYFLSLLNVSLPEIDNLIESAINTGEFESPFYSSPYPIIYIISKISADRKNFLEEASKDFGQNKLINFILNKKQDGRWGNALDTSLAIRALINLGYPEEKIEDEKRHLKTCLAGEIEKPQLFYANSASTGALNIAFYLEANFGRQNPLQFFLNKNGANKQKKETMNGEEKKIMDMILGIAEERFSALRGEIRSFAIGQIKKTIKGNKDNQMALMAYYFKKALGKKGGEFSNKLIAMMGLANIFFWTAFIIYDDFWDEEGEPKILPAANLFARGFTKFFNSILPAKTGFNNYFRLLMDKLDAANTWETVYCRAKVSGDIIIIPENVPDYGNYDAAYEPASAHILGPLAMLYFLGYKEDSEEAQSMISYFRNYLIAMQFNDDMHDWEKDLSRGHLSTVVVLLMRDFQEMHPDRAKIDMKKDLEELRKIFWFKTIKTACEIAIKHTDESRRALLTMTILEDISPLERFIAITENTAKEALKEHKDTTDFLKTYKN